MTSLYQAGVDVVAPQDGRGSGTAGLFWTYESTVPVDPRLRCKTGDRHNGTAFIANSTTLFQAAARARDAIVGRTVELWANIEAFDPGDGSSLECAGELIRTDKSRLDQALTHLGTHVSKVISFQWDPLYTAGGSHSLAEQIRTDHDRPVVSHGFRWTSGGRRGIALYGYHLDAATVRLTWWDAGWQPHGMTISVAESGWFDPRPGDVDNAPFPQQMQAIWVPFPWTDLAPGFYVHADVTTGGRTTSHRYSLAY